MLKSINGSRFLSLAVILGLAALGLGCGDDNPVEDSGETEHMEAYGVQVYDGGTLVAEADGTVVSGSFTVAQNDTTDWLSVLFLDVNGEWYDPEDVVDESDGETHDHGLSITVSGAQVVAEVGDHEEGTEWKFRLAGVTPGQATLRINTLHNDHEDYVSPEFTVTVSE